MQRPLEGALDPELADQRGAGVGHAVDVLEVLNADGADIAHGMYRELAERIVPSLASGEIDAGELVTVHREAADLFVAEPQPDRHAVEGATREDNVAGVVEIIAVDEPERG